MKKILPFLLVLLLPACQKPGQKSPEAKNKFSDPALRTIYTFQDERNTAQLLPYFRHQDARYREAAATAFASVQDKTAVPELAALLTDPEAKVRKAAAHALGQTADSTAENYLIAVLNQETDKPTRAEMFEALGKVATKRGVEMLANYDTNDSVFQAGQVWGLYRAQLRGTLPEAAYGKLVSFLTPNRSRQVRLAAAQSLARSGKADLSRYLPQLRIAMHQEDWYPVRSAIASAIAKINKPEIAETLITLAANDPDYRVKVSALRGMKAQSPVFKQALVQALTDPDRHVRLTAAEILGTYKGLDAAEIEKLAASQTDWRTRAILFGVAVKNTEQQQEVFPAIRKRYEESENIYEKGALLNALGNEVNAYRFLEKETFQAKAPVISTYGMEALSNLRKNKNFPDSLKAPFTQMLKKAVATGDVAMIGTAATLLREPELDLRKTLTNFDFLKAAQAKLKLPREVETYIELQKTLAFLEEKPVPEPPKTQASNPINWDLVQSLPKDQKVRLKTSKGQILLQLYVEEAPGSVANFVALVNQGFFNGLNFHRVVPNFVAQGGDPRGDGWGGTDYTIRSEFADLHYEEGTVGLASAGKDTESCQWFITHNQVPHLDGRYTIFAKVVSGLDVVHQLQIGDKIEKMELVK